MTAASTATPWRSARTALAAALALLLAATAGIIWDDAGLIWDDAGLIWDDASAGSVREATHVVGLAAGASADDLDATVVAELDALGMALVADADATTLAADPAVTFVSTDTSLVATSTGTTDTARLDRSSAHEVKADVLWSRGLTGSGQTVALIDTGVSAHPDLAGRLLHGPNFAGDGTTEDLFGHGTVMAGAIAGDGTASAGRWVGVAPDAQVLSVKVASRDGATDVSQVLAAMQWLVACHVDAPRAGCATTHDAGVVVLAYGTDGTQSATVDPLAYGIQRLHDAGMVVIASAGNGGDGTASTIDGPAAAPAAFTVGAYDQGAKAPATFSEFGRTVDGLVKPEALASGVDIVTPVDTDSTIATNAPHALRDGGYIRGSGSSQAAAIAGGVAALARQAYVTASVDDVRGLLTATLSKGKDSYVGRIDASRLPRSLVGARTVAFRGNGSGTLDGSRGSVRVFTVVDGQKVLVDGEYTAAGNTWDNGSWDAATGDTSSWQGSTWEGATWDGSMWDGQTWEGQTWEGQTWEGNCWDSAIWG